MQFSLDTLSRNVYVSPKMTDDQTSHGPGLLTPKEKRKALAALERIKTFSRQTGELAFVLITFHKESMIYSESTKMPCNST
jgi:hypothetical protein